MLGIPWLSAMPPRHPGVCYTFLLLFRIWFLVAERNKWMKCWAHSCISGRRWTIIFIMTEIFITNSIFGAIGLLTMGQQLQPIVSHPHTSSDKLTHPFSRAQVGTLLHKSRRMRRTITQDFNPFARAWNRQNGSSSAAVFTLYLNLQRPRTDS